MIAAVEATGSDQFERWAADARAREAADSRVRERWMRQQVREEATLAAVLLGYAERASAVVVTTTTGRRHHGLLAGVGDDFAALRTAGGHVVLIPLVAVAEIHGAGSTGPAGSGPAAAEGRPAPGLAVTLADLLSQASGQRPRLAIQAGDASVVGDLESVGIDVLTVTVEGSPPGLAYVRLASVSDISLFASG